MREKIKGIYETHSLLRLATVDKDGLPNVRSVDFAHSPEDESKLYFMTFTQTNKVGEIQANNRVYIVVDKSADTLEELTQVKYIRGVGHATKLENPEEMQMAMGLILIKYPFLKDLPGDPSMMSIFRIDMKEVNVTDNSLGFGHVDLVKY